MSPEAQQQLKTEVINAVQMEHSQTLKKKVCDVAAEVARQLVDEDGNNSWPEFLQFLFQCASSPNASVKESALHMFR